MKKLLLSLVSAFLLFTLSAQVSENFSDYTVGGKLAQQAQAMGRDYWTKWSNAPGGNEDGLIEDMSGNKVLKLAAVSSSVSNDQILRLGYKEGSTWKPQDKGAWELTFKIFIPATKDGYFNIKSVFPSTVSETWATQIYFATDQSEVQGEIGPYTPGVGKIYAASSTPISFSFSHDTWVPVKLFIDLDNDEAKFYVNDNLVHTWQYSLGSFGNSNHKTIAAMNIFPPSEGPRSTFYIDDIVFDGQGGNNHPIMDVIPTEISQDLPAGGTISVPVIVNNTGTSIGNYRSWVAFDVDNPVGNYQFNVGYCGDNLNYSQGFGFIEPGYSELGVKLAGTALCDKVGSSITKMSYYLSGVVENSTIVYRIYGGGTTTNSSGDVLMEFTKTGAVQGWNQVTLPTPLVIDKTDLWLSIGFVQDQEHVYPMSHDDGTQVPGVNWFKRNSESSSWTQFWEDDGQGNPCGNIMLKAYAEGGVVPACWISLTGDFCGYVPKGTSKTFNVALNAAGLELGETYTATLYVETNDEDNPLFTIPCTLKVGEFPLITIDVHSIEKEFPEDAEDKVVTVPLTLSNTGSAEGTYEATVGSVAWLTITGDTKGNIPVGNSKTFDAVIDATELEVGEYSDKISVTTNDLTNPLIEIPCKLVIKLGIEVYINGIETKVYPNPATNMITVESNTIMNSVQIINQTGQVVYSSVVNGELTTVNTSNLSAGYYFVKINTDKGSRSIKFVVK